VGHHGTNVVMVISWHRHIKRSGSIRDEDNTDCWCWASPPDEDSTTFLTTSWQSFIDRSASVGDGDTGGCGDVDPYPQIMMVLEV